MDQGNRRVALVTGGAKRVGKAIVERLAQTGFGVAFTYLSSQAEAETLAGAIGGCAIRADLTDPATAVPQIVEGLAKFSPRLDVLVNSASIYEPSGLDVTNLEQIRKLMSIHYESPLLLSKAFASQLRASKGQIINMVDLLVEKPWAELLSYTGSKAALWNLTLSLAKTLAPEVTVNGIAPGVVEWPPDYPQTEREKYLKRVPLNRAGTPQDVAGLVQYLVTDGNYITGQIIRLDGGRSIA